jgi:hypothetical protein
MFQLIGMGEQAGSGFPKMLRAWMEQHWQYPYMDEDTSLETTTLYMPTISLFPQEIQDDLEVLFGNEYKKLDKDERLALILAYVDKEVTNSRLSNIGAIHSADSSKILRKLVDKSLLISDGIGRGMKYFINNNFKIIGAKPAELENETSTMGTKLGLSMDQVQILSQCMDPKPIKELMEFSKRTNRTKYRDQVINPFLEKGYLELTIPEKPKSPNQRYKLTDLGLKILEELQ